MSAEDRPDWSGAVAEAAWIGERLAPFEPAVVTSVVPGGFEAYARMLHPAEEPSWGTRLVRWAEVAAWSGVPLRRDAQFHTIALPPDRPAADAPWSSQGPRDGSLYPPDAEVLAEIAAAWTATPGQCWFCVWDGYGWENVAPLTTAPGRPAAGSAARRRPRRPTGAFAAPRLPALPGPGRGGHGHLRRGRLSSRPPTCGGRGTARGAWPARSTCPGAMWPGRPA